MDGRVVQVLAMRHCQILLLLAILPGRVLVAPIVALLLVVVQHSKASRWSRSREHNIGAVKIKVLLLSLIADIIYECSHSRHPLVTVYPGLGVLIETDNSSIVAQQVGIGRVRGCYTRHVRVLPGYRT
jgi:hypothetical protein